MLNALWSNKSQMSINAAANIYNSIINLSAACGNVVPGETAVVPNI